MINFLATAVGRQDEIIFPFSEYWWFYGLFTLFVLGMLALDLGVFNRKAHAVGFKEATVWSAVWISLALIFNVLFYFYAEQKFGETVAWDKSFQFFTGYIIEKSLSVDNIFIFVMVFGYFSIPDKYQHRVLFYGILGALVFRAIFIAIGSALMSIEWIIYIFGGFLILTGIKMFFSGTEEIEPEKNFLIRLFRKFMPVTHEMHGQNFFVKVANKWTATPLFIALLFLEATDIIFAVDSVPAIFAITDEPMIVFTSNIFAILGLRSLYFMLAGIINRFHLLKYGLAVILVFVGLKMAALNDLYGMLYPSSDPTEHVKFPIEWSLGFIGGVLLLTTLLSLLIPPKEKKESV